VKRTSVLLAVVLTLVLSLAVVAYAAEADTGDAFDPEALVVGGVALAPLISVLISILKGWVGIDKKYIPLVNVLLGTVAVLVVGVVNNGMSFASALIMTLGIVLGSQVFHETFGHAAKILQELFGGGKPPQEE
jgi:O-antigen ligase